ncbi:MAG: MBL fold metallo-hydrolase [Spirochaetes bacterium]|nr:MBL fold metallo-hydrolase [Spirochaetota bacterium]
MYFEQINTPGLGCFSYVVGCPVAGVMMIVDPRRDTDIYLHIADKNGMRITHIFDTHVHADHISGSQQLKAATNADIYIHENAPVEYEAKKLKNGDEFTFGKAHVRILYTPGHTPDSVSLLISDLARSGKPEMILTGDLLFVGDVGRPDLPGKEILDEQIKNLYNSLYKVLGELPDYLEVYPGHGQGSLCGQGMSAKPYSTLGYERLANPMLGYSDFTDFKQAVQSNLPMRPQSFSGIIRGNLGKVAVTDNNEDVSKYALAADQADELRKSGTVLLDLRDALSFSAAFIPGSIHVDASNSAMLNWIGTAVPPNTPLILILPHDKSFEEMRLELQRIGYDMVKGWLKGGLDTWLRKGLKTQRLPHISVSELKEFLAEDTPPTLIDVRSPKEFAEVKIDSAINLPLNNILEKDFDPGTLAKESIVICKSGFRAGIAASLLGAQEYRDLKILSGGMDAWIESCR